MDREVRRVIVQLHQRWIETLVQYPEQGMGFQLVDVALENGDIVQGVRVYNSEQLDWPENLAPISSEDIVEIALTRKA